MHRQHLMIPKSSQHQCRHPVSTNISIHLFPTVLFPKLNQHKNTKRKRNIISISPLFSFVPFILLIFVALTFAATSTFPNTQHKNDTNKKKRERKKNKINAEDEKEKKNPKSTKFHGN